MTDEEEKRDTWGGLRGRWNLIDFREKERKEERKRDGRREQGTDGESIRTYLVRDRGIDWVRIEREVERENESRGVKGVEWCGIGCCLFVAVSGYWYCNIAMTIAPWRRPWRRLAAQCSSSTEGSEALQAREKQRDRRGEVGRCMSAALMNVYVTIIEAQNLQVSLGRSAGLWSKKKKIYFITVGQNSTIYIVYTLYISKSLNLGGK